MPPANAVELAIRARAFVSCARRAGQLGDAAGFARHASIEAWSVAAAVLNWANIAAFCAAAAGTARAGLNPRLPSRPSGLTRNVAELRVWM
jgi:hypothetical protein